LVVLFVDGEGKIVPEAAGVWLVDVVAAATGLDVASEVEDSEWPEVSAVLVMLCEEDSADETVADVSAGADADEAPAEGLNVAVRPQSSAAAPTWVP